jgi:hypothetical protein
MALQIHMWCWCGNLSILRCQIWRLQTNCGDTTIDTTGHEQIMFRDLWTPTGRKKE